MAISDLRTATQRRIGPLCEVCAFIATLTEADAADLRAILADDTIRYSTIAAGLKDDPDTPIDLAAGTWGRHARGECTARERLRG